MEVTIEFLQMLRNINVSKGTEELKIVVPFENSDFAYMIFKYDGELFRFDRVEAMRETVLFREN